MLSIEAPIERWDEAVPLGNGLLGGLLWGRDRLIKLSLDRGDLWDLRPAPAVEKPDFNYAAMKEAVAAGDHKRLVELFDAPYSSSPYPSKISAGRVEISLAAGACARRFSLDLSKAVGTLEADTVRLEVFFNAMAPVILMRIRSASPIKARLVMPPYGQTSGTEKYKTNDVRSLGYPPSTSGRKGAISWSHQSCTDGGSYAIVLGQARKGKETVLAIAVPSSRDSADPVALGIQRVKAALAEGFDSMLRQHSAWWKEFWSKSSVSIPEKPLQEHYDLVQYFYGAASRRGAPPIPLQGVWTADENTLPPWKGDYHNDLNTQLTYWAYQAANRLEQGLCFLDFLWDLMPAARKFAREFYGARGACFPGVMATNGAPLGGWGMYSLSPTMSAWLAQSFHLHWRYTMDRKFLRDRAYPFCAEVAEFIESFLRPAPDGKLKLPLSSSPEIHDNSLQAWLTPNSNFDLSLLRWLYAAVSEMAAVLGDAAAAARWKNVLGQLDELAVEQDSNGRAGALKLSPTESLRETHRHHSHLMPLYPLGLMTPEGGERDRRVIAHSLHQIDMLGTGCWCGYSFSWMACMAARCGRPGRALNMLHMFLNGFVTRNGFHVNGDFKDQGFCIFKYRPFTLEGNFAAGQAVHELLLQSWGGVIRVFPAVPAEWKDASFRTLRAEGAFLVSAIRRSGKTVQATVTAEVDGELRLRNPFGKARVKWTIKPLRQDGDDLIFSLAAGRTVEGTLVAGSKTVSV
jgi:alpha-L-fucosidase 2